MSGTNLRRSAKPLRLCNVGVPRPQTRSHNERTVKSAVSISKHILDVFKRVLARDGYELVLIQNAYASYKLNQNGTEIGYLNMHSAPQLISLCVSIQNPKYSSGSDAVNGDWRSHLNFFFVKFDTTQLGKIRKQALILLKKLSQKEVWDVMKL